MSSSQKTLDYEFADFETARSILCRKDDYTDAMHPNERALKMGLARPGTLTDYFEFIKGSILEWNDTERCRIESVMEQLTVLLVKHGAPLIGRITFVKTTGREEWNSAYTRSTAIVLPQKKLDSYPASDAFLRLLVHEYFHILMRTCPSLRASLYRLAGFRMIGPGHLDMPEALRRRRLTNPDAPRTDHYLAGSLGGKPVCVVPLTLIKTHLDTVDCQKDILESLFTQFVMIGKKFGGWSVLYKDGMPCTLPLDQLGVADRRFFEHDGAVFEPEEVFADYFTQVLTDDDNKPMGVIYKRMKALIVHHQVENHNCIDL